MINQNEHLNANDIKELYYIAHIANLESILSTGILSHNAVRAADVYIEEHDISNPDVQKCRNKKFSSPRSKKSRALHDYTNLYIQPYNAMLLVIQKETPANQLCVLRINPSILNDRKSEAVMTIKNAACRQARFFSPESWAPSPESSRALTSWRLSGLETAEYVGRWVFLKYKQSRQSEVLLPNNVSNQYIQGIFVCDEETRVRASDILLKQNIVIRIDVHASLFPKPKRGAFSKVMDPIRLFQDESEHIKKKRRKTTSDEPEFLKSKKTSHFKNI